MSAKSPLITDKVRELKNVLEGQKTGRPPREPPAPGALESVALIEDKIEVGTPDPGLMREEIAHLKKEMAELQNQNNENYDKFVRTYAEFENYKKRMAKEQIEWTSLAKEKVVGEILGVLDNLERTLEHGGSAEDMKAVLTGIELVYRDFKIILEKLGLREIKSVGKPFDPHQHEAISQEETTTQKPGMVVTQFQKGYLLGNKLLRPARVSVAKAPVPSKD